jgi:hypothetical protein
MWHVDYDNALYAYQLYHDSYMSFASVCSKLQYNMVPRRAPTIPRLHRHTLTRHLLQPYTTQSALILRA